MTFEADRDLIVALSDQDAKSVLDLLDNGASHTETPDELRAANGCNAAETAVGQATGRVPNRRRRAAFGQAARPHDLIPANDREPSARIGLLRDLAGRAGLKVAPLRDDIQQMKNTVHAWVEAPDRLASQSQAMLLVVFEPRRLLESAVRSSPAIPIALQWVPES